MPRSPQITPPTERCLHGHRSLAIAILAALALAAPSGAESTEASEPSLRAAPPVSVGAASPAIAAAPARAPRTLPGTRAAEAHRLSQLDPSSWLARYGEVSVRSRR